MPYITSKDKEKFEDTFLELEAFHKCSDSGHVLYLLREIIKIYFKNTDRRYARHNDVIGVIVASYIEVCRRLNLRSKLKKEYKNIVKAKRSKLCIEVFQVFKKENTIENVGELNYFITSVLDLHIKEICGDLKKSSRVSQKEVISNEVAYIYSGLLYWFYDNYTEKYEEIKREQNGDVFTL